MHSTATVASAIHSNAAASGLGGTVHGGQQPVVGATVVLWAAGTTGSYGTGSTKIAQTTTDSSGFFSLDNGQGVSPCSTGQYLYLTATGGNPGGGNNSSAAEMVALPTPCGAATGALFLQLNEVTTIAAVTALQQFMSINTSATAPYIGTGTVPWTIGAPASNVIGMANAFTQAGNLANITSGSSAVSTSTATFNGTTYTTTITPDASKINGLADILALCINDSTGSLCTGSSGVLTFATLMKGGGAVVPVDTVQAAYNMLSVPNPQLYSGSTDSSGAAVTTYWPHSTASATYLSSLWTNISADAPFQPYTATTPTDATIQVKWASSGGAVSLTQYPQLAFDSNGNVWYAQGGGASGSAGYVTQYNPAGQMLIAPVTSTPISGGWGFSTYTGATTMNLGGAKSNAIAVDTTNNAWYAGFYTSSGANSGGTGAPNAGSLQSPLVQITPAGVASGYVVGASVGDIMIDGNNNLYFNDIPNYVSGATTNRYYFSELLAAGTPAYSTFYGGMGRQSSNYFLAGGIDQSSNQLAWGVLNACGSIFRSDSTLAAAGGTYPTATAQYAASQVSLSATTPTTCVLNGTIDANNNMWGTNGYLEYIVAPGTGAVTSPTVTQFAAGAGIGQGGLYGGAGVAIDGAGNIWVANNPGSSTVTGGLSEFSAVVTNSVPVITPLSPSGSSSALYGFGAADSWLKPTQPRIDLSGNVWLENTGNSTIAYLVGVAAPVVTPTSLMIKNAKIGVRP
ncbi:hypothetical protein [Granulicella rosea]|nr:hypothetical protein [Granulicella rosea]